MAMYKELDDNNKRTVIAAVNASMEFVRFLGGLYVRTIRLLIAVCLGLNGWLT
jgi:hypothetical protein